MEKGIMRGLDPGQIRTSEFRRKVGKTAGKESLYKVCIPPGDRWNPADTEGQLCEAGSQGGREVQEAMINTRDLQVLGVSDALWK